MGRIYLEHIGGKRLFSCAQCDTFLTNRNELISTRFTGATGRAFLFNKVVNLRYRLVKSRRTEDSALVTRESAFLCPLSLFIKYAKTLGMAVWAIL